LTEERFEVDAEVKAAQEKLERQRALLDKDDDSTRRSTAPPQRPNSADSTPSARPDCCHSRALEADWWMRFGRKHRKPIGR
jgi:hypothetical protein